MQCPREGWWLTRKCCAGMQGITVWRWQSLAAGVLAACSSYTTMQGSSEGWGISPPHSTHACFFSLLYTASFPYYHFPVSPSFSQLSCSPQGSPPQPRSAVQLQLARTSHWRKRWGRGTQAMPRVSFGDLWEPVEHVQAAGMGLGMEESFWFLLPPCLSLMYVLVS